MRNRSQPAAVLLCLSCFLGIASARADSLIQVLDSGGQAAPDAVVYAQALSGPLSAKAATAEIEQKDKTFIPLVTVVQTGTAIFFPNNDTVRHHAYSFSPARPFELKLYSGKPAAPILFDKAGTVVVGCNIHDHMIAYIQVVDTPYFAKTDSKGQARLPAMPPGKYTLKVWHYKQLSTGAAPQEQNLPAGDDGRPVVVRLNIKAG
ncbi:MAG: methylamine utilization protein [Burkholderiales bacterium]|nr:methylamine utilization protein [Burkholderiales bacterium]